MWCRWFVFSQILLLFRLASCMPGSSSNFKINPKPCTGNSYEGTCMFVWECIKSEGQHIGMCVDSFMFGSCCAHNLTDNIVLPQTIVYKPSYHQKHKTPPPVPNRPITSGGTTTIHRPHGAGTIVIRPSATQRPYQFYKPDMNVAFSPSATTSTTSAPPITVKIPSLSLNTIADLDTSASISTGKWNFKIQM